MYVVVHDSNKLMKYTEISVPDGFYRVKIYDQIKKEWTEI